MSMATSPKPDAKAAHKWQFASRFRRNAFGWKSDTPIQRIKEALSEIKMIARKEPVLAAEGAIVLLEKLSPALMSVDSSSGALGSMVNHAIETLVPILTKAQVNAAIRKRWLDRLWDAVQEDEMPYIEYLADFWGELCASPEVASAWADQFLPIVERIWSPAEPGYAYFKGTDACLSALYAAGRHEDLLALVDKARHKSWHNRRWGVKALTALGKKSESVRYAEASRGLNAPDGVISEACESLLLSSGLLDEAYARYAIAANQSTTNLATFRAIVKKYPHKDAADVLHDLVKSTPGAEGKWFAAAKDAGLFDVAIELARRSPTDPRTLTRAARDFSAKRPEFAFAAGLTSLAWMARGHGYELTGLDVHDAYDAVMQAAQILGTDEFQTKAQIRLMIDVTPSAVNFVQKVLQVQLSR
jgi:hypothetical protein